ncbi:MAG TPA: EAL domain-containing protein, partial [Treponemataceae bacterium]|nr:EAL domain-containing protein [Treponemataceae bacterium]
ESSDFCLEITETATRLSPALMNENMAKFVAAGFRLAIDDYGTGYSNVEMMLETTFHTVKIDRSMITAADQSEEGRKVLEDLIMMFKSMDLSIVAEGVETGDQLAMVESLGVDLIQGYYYSRPLPEKEFVLFLDKRRR